MKSFHISACDNENACVNGGRWQKNLIDRSARAKGCIYIHAERVFDEKRDEFYKKMGHTSTNDVPFFEKKL